MAGILLNRSRQVPAEDTPAFGGIAERFRRAGDLDRAIALCREGLRKFPDQLSARVTLGWSLLDKGQYDEARAELERVLRRAPDNLAAIRGLAELHDRSEGALPSMDERESWRSEEPAQEAAVSAADAVAAPPPVAVGPADDPFAPISVTLASATEQPSPEILHTAEDAQRAAQAAAARAAADALLGPAPSTIQLEHPAAVAMAAAGASVTAAIEPAEPSLLGADDLAAAAASLDIDVAAFDPGVPVAEPAAQAFSPIAAEAPVPVDVKLDTVSAAYADQDFGTAGEPGHRDLLLASAESGEMDIVFGSLDEARPAAYTDDLLAEAVSPSWLPAAPDGIFADALLGPQAEFSDAESLVASLHSEPTTAMEEPASLLLEMPAGEEAALDESLTLFEAPVADVDLRAMAAPCEDVDTPATLHGDIPVAPAVDEPLLAPIAAFSPVAVEPIPTSHEVTTFGDAFELSAMSPVDVVVHERAYDISSPPAEDHPSPVPAVPAEELDAEQAAEVGQFDLPNASADDLALTLVPAAASFDLATHVLAAPEEPETQQGYVDELAFALTAPDLVPVEAETDVLAAEEPFDAAPMGPSLLDLSEVEPAAAVIAPAEEPALAQPLAAASVGDEYEAPAHVDELLDETALSVNSSLALAVEPVVAAALADIACVDQADPHGSAGVVMAAPRTEARRIPLAALERFLRQVERRRLQLQTGSVA
jgi:tetratricopeptide (TPR) repeat protein